MDQVSRFLLGIAFLLAAGIFSELLFRKTKIPDALWLVGLGIVVGPVMQLVDLQLIKFALPYFAAITLIVVLFEGGRNLPLVSLQSTLGRSTMLALWFFTISTVAIALLSWVGVYLGIFESWNWYKAFTVGAILGGSSSIVIMPTMQFGGVSDKLSNLLSVESAVTDALCVVMTVVMIELALGTRMGNNPLGLLASNVGYGVGFGLAGGVLWILIIPFLGGRYNYTITFASLCGFYVLVTQLQGSAALAILVFSVIVGNGQMIAEKLQIRGRRKLSWDVDLLHQQLTFFVKTFFFLLIGVLLRPPFTPMLLGVIFAVVIILSRHYLTGIALWKSGYSQGDQGLIALCLPRGLAAGVLATLPLTKGLGGMQSLPTVVFTTVVVSIIYFSIAFARWHKKNGHLAEAPEDQASSRLTTAASESASDST